MPTLKTLFKSIVYTNPYVLNSGHFFQIKICVRKRINIILASQCLEIAVVSNSESSTVGVVSAPLLTAVVVRGPVKCHGIQILIVETVTGIMSGETVSCKTKIQEVILPHFISNHALLAGKKFST